MRWGGLVCTCTCGQGRPHWEADFGGEGVGRAETWGKSVDEGTASARVLRWFVYVCVFDGD